MPRSARQSFLKEYPAAIVDDGASIFVGAGVSVGAGYPSWAKLLHEIGEELDVRSSDVHDLAALAQWSIQESGSATKIRTVIRDQIGVVRPVPDVLRIVARLPLRHLWTTNYDGLIEASFKEISRPLDVISSEKDLAIRPRPGAARLYKMHGTVERLDDLVISTDDYELFRSKRGAFLPLLQAHLTTMSMLFIGLSFTDPNVRHVLSLIRESFTDAPPEHFAIVRPPQEDDYASKEEFSAKATQHSLWAKDLRRYGLRAVEIDDYSEVPALLADIERRVASRRVWVSGSWPVDGDDGRSPFIYALSEAVGAEIGRSGLSLVSGTGLLVGSASVGGFLNALRSGHGWDLERRLLARPFPQPLPGQKGATAQWAALRREMARLSGIVIFIGGEKVASTGAREVADGVLDEMTEAVAAGSFLLPIGATGGAAAIIAELLSTSGLPTDGERARRPTNEELHALDDSSATVDSLVALVAQILKRVTSRS